MNRFAGRVVDLHCHSDRSDGILSPEALVSRAKARDVSVLALTDHDTIAGLAAAKAQAALEGMTLLNGIEFSCQWQGRGIHIVGLNFDDGDQDLLALIARQHQRRMERSAMIAEKLERAGFDNALARAKTQAGEASLGRPHFAHAMVEAGFVRSVDQAFKRYLGSGKPGDVKQVWPEFEEVVPVVRAAGGAAVVAHPLKYKMTRTKLRAMLDDFRDCGGNAMEVVSGAQRPEQTREMAQLAGRFALLSSCGSDFHMPGTQWGELGKFPALPETVTPVWSLWPSLANESKQ